MKLTNLLTPPMESNIYLCMYVFFYDLQCAYFQKGFDNSILKRRQTRIPGKLKFGVCVCVRECVSVSKLSINVSRRILNICIF